MTNETLPFVDWRSMEAGPLRLSAKTEHFRELYEKGLI